MTLHRYRGFAVLRRAAGLALIGLGAALFWYAFSGRQLDELIELGWLAHRQGGAPFWTDFALWTTVLDGAVQPLLYGMAAAIPGIVLVSGGRRRAARWAGAGLLAFTAFAAFRAFPPLMGRPEFAPAPWSPFVLAVLAGGVPGMMLLLGPWIVRRFSPRRDGDQGV